MLDMINSHAMQVVMQKITELHHHEEQETHFLTIWMTSSSAMTWVMPTLWGLNLVLFPHTKAYLQSLARVLKVFVENDVTNHGDKPVDAITDVCN